MIIVDFSQLCIAAYMQGGSHFDNTESDLDMFRHMVLNSLRVINSKHIRQYKELVIAVDSPKQSWRKKVFPYYKAQRAIDKTKSPIDWSRVARYIDTVKKEVDAFLPYRMIESPHAEADDVIGTLVRHHVEQQVPVLIASGDKDFIQLQIGTNKVTQWDNARQKWVGATDPKRYLFEHVIKGDRGDGVPNVFCVDDHFISKPGKAPAITQKKLDYWWSGGFEDIRNLPGFKRNVRLIDLRKTPEPLQANIMEIFGNTPIKQRGQLLGYFIQNNLKTLASQIGDF